ncbi:hypothetical protein MMPV_004785 [Pyropia vietnamensis]
MDGHLPWAAITLSPLCLIVAVVTLVLARREAHAIGLCVGMVTSEVVNHFLKAAIAQPRPDFPGVFTPGHGMPSDHAQFSAFFFVFTAAFFSRRRAVLGAGILPAWQEAAMLAGLGVNAVLTAASRVVLGYHTVEQVVAGGVVGVVFGGVWAAVVVSVGEPLAEWAVTTPLGRALRLRDSSWTPDALAVERDALLPASECSGKKVL